MCYPRAMPNRSSKPPKRPRDLNQLAAQIVAEATGQAPKEQPAETDPLREAARELGRRGGLKGGLARAEKLSPARRRKIALIAAKARWKKK